MSNLPTTVKPVVFAGHYISRFCATRPTAKSTFRIISISYQGRIGDYRRPRILVTANLGKEARPRNLVTANTTGFTVVRPSEFDLSRFHAAYYLSQSEEARLFIHIRDALLTRSPKETRPVNRHTDIVNVKFSIALLRVDSFEQTTLRTHGDSAKITLSTWLRHVSII